MTYDDLQQAFLAHRREHGAKATADLLNRFHVDALDSVKESDWFSLHAALTGDGQARPPQSTAEALAALRTAAFNKWNNEWVKHRD